MKNKSKIIPHIAVDTNIIIALTVFSNNDQEISQYLRQYEKNKEKIERLVKHNVNLRREFCNPKTHEVMEEKLRRIYHLYENIKKRNINLYITKTVLGELGLIPKKVLTGAAGNLYVSEMQIKRFLEDESNNVTVLTVDDKDSKAFALSKLRLSIAYADAGAMGKEYNSFAEDYYPSKDAEIAAEASLFGLYLITLNEKHFIHKDCNANDGLGDFERSRIINEINYSYGLSFDSSNQKKQKEAPEPISLHSFMKRFINSNNVSKSFFTYPNINEETNEIEYYPLNV